MKKTFGKGQNLHSSDNLYWNKPVLICCKDFDFFILLKSLKKVGYSCSILSNQAPITSLLKCPFPKDFSKIFNILLLSCCFKTSQNKVGSWKLSGRENLVFSKKVKYFYQYGHRNFNFFCRPLSSFNSTVRW